MSEVVVQEKALLRAWREAGSGDDLDMLLKTKAPAAEVLPLVNHAVDELWEQSEAIGVSAPAVTPHGLAIVMNFCDSQADLVDMFTRLKANLEALDVSGTLGVFRHQASPIDDVLLKLDLFRAAMSLSGQPLPYSEVGMNAPTVWKSDADALAMVVEHALDWCEVPGGTHYLNSGLAQFTVAPEQRRAFLIPPVGPAKMTMTCTNGTHAVRRVAFTGDGHILYEHGGTDTTTADWPAGVAEVTTVLADLASAVDYAIVRRDRRPSWDWLTVFQASWPAMDNLRIGELFLTRRYERDHVVDAFGIQLLGPGHDPAIPADDHWNITDLPAGRRLVTHRDQAAWFSDELPDQTTLANARHDFAPILLNHDLANEERARRTACRRDHPT